MARKTRFAAIAFAASVAVALAGCAGGGGGDGEAADDGQLTIGLTVNDTTSFVNEGKEALQAYADANDIKLIINDPKGDVTVQASQIEQFIRQGVDGIM